MAGKSLADLNLQPDVVVAGVDDISDLPEFGAFIQPPPGFYGFKIPAFKVNDPVWGSFTTKDPKTGQDVERLELNFDGDFKLEIVHAPNLEAAQRLIGQFWGTRLTNNPRKRDRAGEIFASDADYLLRAVGVTKRPSPATNKNYALALAQQCAGKTFGATVEYSYSCNPNREAQIPDGVGGFTDTGRKGCGNRYYQSQIDLNPDGTAPDRIQCECGAHVRGFANLTNIKAWKPSA
jgi:hypothetical protein